MHVFFLLPACCLAAPLQSSDVHWAKERYGKKISDRMCSSFAQCSTPFHHMRKHICPLHVVRRTKKGIISSQQIISKTKEDILIKKKKERGSFKKKIENDCKTYRVERRQKICVKLHNENKTWTEAQKVCQACGGRLIKANNRQRMRAIKLLIGWEMLTDTAVHFWVGAVDLHKHDTFYWTDESPVGNRGWDSGEPTHVSFNEDGGRFQEDCMSIVFIYPIGFYYHDDFCNALHEFICECD